MIMYKATTWKVNNSLVIGDLGDTSQNSGLNPCSASSSVLFLDSFLVQYDSVPHL